MGVLQAKNLKKVYRGAEDVYALDDVSLKVKAGEFVAILDHLAVENPHCSIFLERWTLRQRGKFI